MANLSVRYEGRKQPDGSAAAGPRSGEHIDLIAPDGTGLHFRSGQPVAVSDAYWGFLANHPAYVFSVTSTAWASDATDLRVG